MKKYEFTGETKDFCGVELHRIRALKDFGDVAAGDLGGWIKGEENLSHDGRCWVYGTARVYGNAQVSGDAQVSDDARVYGNARVSDDAHVYGNSQVYGNAWVAGDAEIKAPKDTFWISAIGSRYGTTTFFRCADGKVRVTCDCFYGDLDEFLAKVEKTHGDSKHGKVYKKLIELAKIQMEEDV